MKITMKNVFTTLLFQLLTIICGFIIPKLIISNYGSDVNGLIVSITSFLAYITLLEAGFGTIIRSLLYKPISENNIQEIEKILKTSEKLFRRISYIFVIYIIILCIIFPFLPSNSFDAFYTVSLIIIIAINVFSEYFFGITYKLYLNSTGEIYIISIIQTVTLLLNTLLVILLIKIGASIHLVKLASTLILILRPITLKLFVKFKYKINLKNVSGNYEIKQKWDALIQHIAYVIHSNVDIVLITLFLNIKEASVYSIYLLIVNGLKNVVSSFLGGVDAKFGNMLVKKDYDRLNDKFKIYINTYNTIATIIYCSTFFLIIPLVRIYTKGINDTNYIRPLFSYLLVLSGFITMLKQPYYDLVKAAGHFNETKKGAILEALLNLLLSVILIFKYGIIGIVIGTVISTLVRTIEIMYYTSKNILNISFMYVIKRLLIIVIQIIIVYFIINSLLTIKINNYIDWVIYAIVVTIISSLVIISSNLLLNIKINNKK